MLISGWLLPQRASSSTYLSERTLSSNKPTLSVFIPDLGFRLRTEEVPLIARIDAAGVSLRVKNTTEDCQFLYFLGDQPVGRLVPVIVGRKLESGTVQPVPVDERRLQVDYLIAACARLRLEVLPHSEDRAVFGFAQFLRRIHGRANWVQDEDHGIAAQTGLHGNLIKKVVDRPLRIRDALLQHRGRTGRTGVRIPGSTARATKIFKRRPGFQIDHHVTKKGRFPQECLNGRSVVVNASQLEAMSVFLEVMESGLGLVLEKAFVEIIVDDKKSHCARAKAVLREFRESEVLRQRSARNSNAIHTSPS